MSVRYGLKSAVPSLELRHHIAAARIVGCGGDDLLAEIVVDVVRHRGRELIGRDRGAEQIGIAVPGDGVGAGAGHDVEGLLLLHVVEHRECDVARLNADHQVDLVAFNELFRLLQSDLRVELVVLFDQLDLSAGDSPIDAVEIEIHSVQIVLARVGQSARVRIDVADPDRSISLRQYRGRRQSRRQSRSRAGGVFYEGSPRNLAACQRCGRRMWLKHSVSPLNAVTSA
jgi:hypothetical protein